MTIMITIIWAALWSAK